MSQTCVSPLSTEETHHVQQSEQRNWRRRLYPLEQERHDSADEESPHRTAALGHTKLDSTVRILGIEVDDAVEMSGQMEA